jgi:hypothetical protein
MKIQAIHLLDFGQLETDKEEHEESPSSPLGYFLRPTQITFINRTDRLQATKGLKFGIEYFIEGFDNNEDEVEFYCKISHPTMVNPITKAEQKEVYEKKTDYTNQHNFDYYRLEFDWEVVGGIWTFEIMEEGKVLVKKEFKIE